MRHSRTTAPIDGRSLVGVLQGTGERDATPFFYLRLRIPFGDQHHQIGAVRDGRWKLKLPQRGYPQLLEPLAKTELYWHGLLLFDLEADPGEQHDVAAEHPDVVERLEGDRGFRRVARARARRCGSRPRRRTTPAGKSCGAASAWSRVSWSPWRGSSSSPSCS